MKNLITILIFAALTVTAFGQFLSPTNPPAKVQLAWDHSPDASVTGYNIYYGTNGSRLYLWKHTTGYTNQTTIPNLVRGVPYYFTATAFDATGLESEFCNEVTYTAPKVPGGPKLRLAASMVATKDGQMELLIQPMEFLAEATPLQATTDLKEWHQITLLGGMSGDIAYAEPPKQPKVLYRLAMAN